jgi:hypothetical protein
MTWLQRRLNWSDDVVTAPSEFMTWLQRRLNWNDDIVIASMKLTKLVAMFL